jgi:hypothetical protein
MRLKRASASGLFRRPCAHLALAFASSALAFVTSVAAQAPAQSAPTSPEPQVSAKHPAGAPTEEEIKEANNPVASIASLNFQNYYASRLSEVAGASANSFYLRFAAPFGPLLARATLPVVTTSAPGASASGLGDFNAFVTWRLTRQHAPLTIAVGPLYVAPTATDDSLGTGKHQLGGAFIAMQSVGPLLIGTLLQYQHSIAGDETRPSTSVFIPQLFAILQMGGGTYLRSAPIASFDTESGNYNVPFGLGIGHVAKVEGVIVNAFIEPQYTLLSQGPGQPLFQIFSAVNLQFPL